MSNERAVAEVFANYVRATDRRDGPGLSILFSAGAIVQLYAKTGPGQHEPVGEPLVGGAGVAFAVDNYIAPHPPGGSSHHTTFDQIITVDGDSAHFNAQFIVYEVRSPVRPDTGWPADTPLGFHGTVRPIESGYYDSELRRIEGTWTITNHRILLDAWFVLPSD